MARDEHRSADPRRQCPYQQPHGHDAVGIETVGWFVQQQQSGRTEHRPRQRQALLHPKRIGAGPCRCRIAHLDDLQHPIDLACRQTEQTSRDVEIGPAGEMVVQRGAFDKGSHLGKGIAPPPDQVVTDQPDRARIRPQQAEQQAHRRGLAGAVRTQKAVDAPHRYAQRHIVDHAPPSVAFGQMLGFDCQHRFSPIPTFIS
ncbi:hypothetical protein NS258_06400 [Sphingomonas sanguinis]|uniref:Uncharacterized protein n=1 Tax=Sphingomonas sanguinis TaxID=33051 RepID=A0A147JA23_9SPHN|nr:hypothetical protein NS258_06400 [Sphingomonas sanguinis]